MTLRLIQQKLIFIGLFLIASTFVSVAEAAQVRGLYTTTVDVENQSAETRAEVLPQAMSQVLLKLTGKSEVANSAQLQAVVQSAAKYVAQFRYVQSQQTLNSPPSLQLWVQFDRRALERQLKGRAAIWSSERPLVLAVVAYNYLGKRYILSENSGDDLSVYLRRQVKQAASQRGLPIVLPKYDAADKRAVTPADIWSGFYDRTAALQSRYNADASAIIGLKIYDSGNAGYSASGRWVLRENGLQSQTMGLNREGLSSALAAAMDGVTNELVSSYVSDNAYGSEGIQQDVTITVVGISRFGDYATVMQHLNSRSAVKKATLLQAAGEQLELKLQLSSAIDLFQQQLKLGRVLDVAASDPLNPTVVGELKYQLINR